MTTITVDNQSPRQGDVLTFHVVTDVANTGCKITVSQSGGTTTWPIEFHPAGSYDKRIGLDAPNWPAGTGGQLAAAVISEAPAKGGKTKTTTLATLSLTITP